MGGSAEGAAELIVSLCGSVLGSVTGAELMTGFAADVCLFMGALLAGEGVAVLRRRGTSEEVVSFFAGFVAGVAAPSLSFCWAISARIRATSARAAALISSSLATRIQAREFSLLRGFLSRGGVGWSVLTLRA